jgi:hypothetical protein
MQYMVRRGGEEYGPYTLADLRRFAFSRHIASTDEVRGSNERTYYPASLLLGSEAWPVAATPTPVAATPGSPPPGAYLPAYQKPQMANGAPLPPKLHWALLLVLGPLTCGVMYYLWFPMQAWWMRQLDPPNKAFWYTLASVVSWYCPLLGIQVVSPMIEHLAKSGEVPDIFGAILVIIFALILIASFSFYFAALFQIHNGLMRYFNEEENIGLRLNPVFTALGGIFYLQYHFTRIAKWKTTGVLD